MTETILFRPIGQFSIQGLLRRQLFSLRLLPQQQQSAEAMKAVEMEDLKGKGDLR